MTDILMVTNEPVWPATAGGRARIAGMAGALAERFSVTVAQPALASGQGPVAPAWQPAGIPVVSLGAGTSSRVRSLANFLHWKPRLGLTLIDAASRRQLHAVARALKPRVIFLSHSYLAPVLPFPGVPIVVDFPNVEFNRLRSMATEATRLNRASALWETAKAWNWEPRTARRCQVAVSVSTDDASFLRRWRDDVVVVPNAAAGVASWTPSPERGPVTYIANVLYRPNLEAGRLLIRDIWPRVVAAVPGAELRLVGRGTAEQFAGAGELPGVSVAGEVGDLAPFLASASMLVAPVLAGGGTQLKVVEGLAHGRTVVATRFSFRSVPAAAAEGCLPADTTEQFAQAITGLLTDPDERHRRERSLVTPRRAIPTWQEACAPLIEVLEPLVA